MTNTSVNSSTALEGALVYSQGIKDLDPDRIKTKMQIFGKILDTIEEGIIYVLQGKTQEKVQEILNKISNNPNATAFTDGKGICSVTSEEEKHLISECEKNKITILASLKCLRIH